MSAARLRLFLLLFFPSLLHAGAGQDVLTKLNSVQLDPTGCYRIRDVNLVRDEAQFFFTDGYLIFTKPVGDTPVIAFFSADVEGGDAELLLLPPSRNERRLLSAKSGSPNLEEHFHQAGLVFTADTYRELMSEIARNPFNKKSPEMGVLLADRWSLLAQSLATNFGLRLSTDLLSPSPNRKGMLATTIAGTKLGAFNLIFDPRIPEQIMVGASTEAGFDVWTSFTSRSYRGRPFAPRISGARLPYRNPPRCRSDHALRHPLDGKARRRRIRPAL